MDFTTWCETRDYLLGIAGYSGDTSNYFEDLKRKIDELDLNEGLKEIYIKMHGPKEIEKFYFFYSERLSIISLESTDITIDDLYLIDLEKVRYEFKLNSKLENKLTLKFKNKSMTLDPIQDTDSSEYSKYNDLLKEIYLLVK